MYMDISMDTKNVRQKRKRTIQWTHKSDTWSYKDGFNRSIPLH